MTVPEDFGWEDAAIVRFRRALLDWFVRHKRELPWRGVKDPYAVLVSEMMLQQTQVVTVIAYYDRWMERFPGVEDLARAPLESVLEVWAGLGYYRRARFLHRAAQEIMSTWGGQLPSTAKELRTLPGIGAYTAGAVASIAFGKPEPVVDGNVSRVLARLFCLDGDLSRGEGQRTLWGLAGVLVDKARPGDFNQALMELGATVCMPRNPTCVDCPVQDQCAAFAEGDPARYPTPAERTRQRPVAVGTSVVVAKRNGETKFLVVQRPAEGLLAGLWQFPSIEQEGKAVPDPQALLCLIESYLETPAPPHVRHGLGQVVHQFSHIRWRIEAELFIVEDFEPSEARVREGLRWVNVEELKALPMSAAMRKIEGLLQGFD